MPCIGLEILLAGVRLFSYPSLQGQKSQKRLRSCVFKTRLSRVEVAAGYAALFKPHLNLLQKQTGECGRGEGVGAAF